MEPSENFYVFLQRALKLSIFSIGVILILLIAQNCNAQVDFTKIPAKEKFTNIGTFIHVKNTALTQYDKELDCTWKTSYAEIDGLLDLKTQDFLNDWLKGMTYFGNCEGDKECYDFQFFHYYYKITRVTLVRNDLLGFYLQEGNCKKANDNCIENQDWEIYDLRTKRFLQDYDFFRQDEKSQKNLADLIERKVKSMKLNLVADWRAYTKQFGLDGDNVAIYLSNDMLNHKKGLLLKFTPSEIYSLLEPCIESRLFNKTCDTQFGKIPQNQSKTK